MEWFYFYKKAHNNFDYLIKCMIIRKKCGGFFGHKCPEFILQEHNITDNFDS